MTIQDEIIEAIICRLNYGEAILKEVYENNDGDEVDEAVLRLIGQLRGLKTKESPQKRIDRLREALRHAGEARDWDACDQIEGELRQLGAWTTY
jgi:hypothetical protein